MKKKIICTIILLIFFFLLTAGCVFSFSDSGSTDTNKELNPKDFADMEKAFDALMLSSLENNLTYDSENPLFFWSSLYYGIINNVDEIPFAKRVDDEIHIFRTSVMEFASGLFADYSDLPDIPVAFPLITYHADEALYTFIPMERGPVSTRILQASVGADNSFLVTAALYNEESNEPLCCFHFTLISNKDDTDTTEPLFLYRISDMTRSDAVNVPENLPALTGIYQGFSDNHTAEFLIDDNLVAFQIQNPDISTFLSLAKEGDEITFSVKVNKFTDERIITSIIGK